MEFELAAGKPGFRAGKCRRTAFVTQHECTSRHRPVLRAECGALPFRRRRGATGVSHQQDQVRMPHRQFRERGGLRVRYVKHETVCVFLCREPVDQRGRQVFVRGARQRWHTELQHALRRQHPCRAVRSERLAELSCERRGVLCAIDRHDGDGPQFVLHRRSTRRSISQPAGDSTGDMASKLGSLARQSIEGARTHAQQQAVANCADTGTADPAGQHSDFADGLARLDLGQQAPYPPHAARSNSPIPAAARVPADTCNRRLHSAGTASRRRDTRRAPVRQAGRSLPRRATEKYCWMAATSACLAVECIYSSRVLIGLM